MAQQKRARSSSISTSREGAVNPENLRVTTAFVTKKGLGIMNVKDDAGVTRQLHSHREGEWHQVPYKQTRTKNDQRRMSVGSKEAMEALFTNN